MTRLKFNEPLSTSFKDDTLPKPLLDLLLYMNEEGVTVPDLFRRPGNATEQKKLIKKLSDGKDICFTDYNFYTLASVIKRFLLSIPGGILGRELEEKALTVLYLDSKEQQIETLSRIIRALPRSVQRFLTLLFGVWFRIADRHHLHQMTSEAMAKSVTGSIFLNVTADPQLVICAAKVMQIMIENFSCSTLFGEDNLEYFKLITSTSIISEVRDHGTDPLYSANKEIHGDMLEIDQNEETKLCHFETVRNKQMDRLKKRSDWFLNPNCEQNTSATRKHAKYTTRATIACVPLRQHEEEELSSIEDLGDDDMNEDNERFTIMFNQNTSILT